MTFGNILKESLVSVGPMDTYEANPLSPPLVDLDPPKTSSFTTAYFNDFLYL